MFSLPPRQRRLAVIALAVYLVFQGVGNFVFGMAPVVSVLGIAVYLAFVFGTLVGSKLSYADGIEKGIEVAVEQFQEVIEKGVIVATVTVEESVAAPGPDDERRRNAPFN